MNATSPKTPAVFAAIHLVMRDIGPIAKSRQNKPQDYWFRGIDDLYAAFQPCLIRHGLFIVPSVKSLQREERTTRSGGLLNYTILTVEHTFYAVADGSSVTATTLGEAMDSGDKSANKAMSAAMKYALLEVFAIPTEGDHDTENTSPRPAAAAGAEGRDIDV